MTAPDPALTAALDRLSLQVNRDNILAAHKVFHDYAEQLRTYLASTAMTIEIGLCGGDPVSKMAAGANSFGGKVHQLLEPHWAHCRELQVAADHLRSIALTYGHTEAEVAQSLQSSIPPR